MDISNLKRDSSIADNFVTSGDRVLTKQDCSFLIPFNYLGHKLAKTGEQVFTAAIFCIVVGDRYAVCTCCANLEISPDEINQIKIRGEEYLEFSFVAGQVVIPTQNVLVDSDLAYEINKYFYTYGRVPWFMSYDDVNVILKYHKEYSGLNISPNNIPFEIVTSKITRDRNNKFVYYRHTGMAQGPVVVPFKSVLFNATNTTSKFLGSYLSDGFTSALLSPSESVETVETLLRA